MGQCLINRQLIINVAPVIDIYNHNKSHGKLAKTVNIIRLIKKKPKESERERTLKNQWDYFRCLVTRDYRKYSLSGLMKDFPFLFIFFFAYQKIKNHLFDPSKHHHKKPIIFHQIILPTTPT